MGYGTSRARAKSIGKSIPKGMTIRDIEIGFLTKRLSYSYCKSCGYVADGWPSSRSRGYRYRRRKVGGMDGDCPKCRKSNLKNSWIEINWKVLVDALGIPKKHDLPSWYKNE